MNQFRNRPTMTDEHGNVVKVIYVHQPLTIEHFGIHAKIQENGRILLSSPPETDPETKEIYINEVEIPASLVFKLANLLRDTRTVKPATMKDGE
jgi:hypothetical protein